MFWDSLDKVSSELTGGILSILFFGAAFVYSVICFFGVNLGIPTFEPPSAWYFLTGAPMVITFLVISPLFLVWRLTLWLRGLTPVGKKRELAKLWAEAVHFCATMISTRDSKPSEGLERWFRKLIRHSMDLDVGDMREELDPPDPS